MCGRRRHADKPAAGARHQRQVSRLRGQADSAAGANPSAAGANPSAAWASLPSAAGASASAAETFSGVASAEKTPQGGGDYAKGTEGQEAAQSGGQSAGIQVCILALWDAPMLSGPSFSCQRSCHYFEQAGEVQTWKFEVIKITVHETSVVDPDPVSFGPPGSGSVIVCTDPDLDPDPSIIKQKNS